MNNLNVIEMTGTTMSSLEIAELTNKLHKSVLRDIRTLMAKLDINPGGTEPHPKENQGVTAEYLDNGMVRCYHLDIDLTMTLITGYDTVRRHAVMKRWREIELGEAQPAVAPVAHDPRVDGLIEAMTSMTNTMTGMAKTVEGLVTVIGNISAAPQQRELQLDKYLCVTELGSMWKGGVSARRMNKILQDQGFQYNHKGVWFLTEKGEVYGSRITRPSGGHAYRQVRWMQAVLNQLR